MWNESAAYRLGTGLRMMREAEGRSQEALAHAAGITKNQVQLLEAGRSSGRKDASGPPNPRMTTLDGVARALGLSVAEFLARAERLAALSDRMADGLDDYADEAEDDSWIVEDGHIPDDAARPG